MQKADVVLSAIRKCGEKGEPLQRVYRQLFNRELYLLAYGKIYRNAGATTPGPDTETVDGMSIARIEKIINLLKSERYEWKPVRRVYIEKRNSTKQRPLGIPGWNDKLVQEVIPGYYWKLTTSLNSVPVRTDSGPIGDATQR